MDKKQACKKSESSLGGFWDKWVEDLEAEERAVEELRQKRKQGGTGYGNDDRGSD